MKNFIIILLLFFCKCQNRSTFIIPSRVGQIFIPASIKSEYGGNDNTRSTPLYATYKTIYFLNDSTIFLFNCVNSNELTCIDTTMLKGKRYVDSTICQNVDSVVFGIENIEEFKGSFKDVGNSFIAFNIHRKVDSFSEQHSEIKIPDSVRSLHAPTDFIKDTLKVDQTKKDFEFVYENNVFKKTTRFTKESRKKLFDLIRDSRNR